MAGASVIHIGNRPHAVLRDLDRNSEYYVMVNGTLGAGTALLTSRPVRFSLDGRGLFSLGKYSIFLDYFYTYKNT